MNREQNLARRGVAEFFKQHPDAAAFFIVAGLELEYVRMAILGVLTEDIPQSQYTPAGAKHGLNDFRRLGYGGPCPPPGKPHRYFFKLYALDTVLDLKPGLTKRDVERAMEKHVLAQAQLMGTYKRG